MQREGAHYLVFAWPAFWWMHHYKAFIQHLRERYRCKAETDRAVVFDLEHANE
jgi:hypothetical protein